MMSNSYLKITALNGDKIQQQNMKDRENNLRDRSRQRNERQNVFSYLYKFYIFVGIIYCFSVTLTDYYLDFSAQNQ